MSENIPKRHNQLFALLSQQSQSAHVDRAAMTLRSAPMSDAEMAQICQIAVDSFAQRPQEA